MKLQFRAKEIPHWAARYRYSRGEEEVTSSVVPVKNRGFLTKADLRELVSWKSTRIVKHVDRNTEQYVREVTACALSAREERTRIEVLTVLNGVSWPVASCILHFYHESKYPILDFRALWSVGTEMPNSYTFDFWWTYVVFCREVAKRSKVHMRTLDKALWQYSKEEQRTKEQ